MKKYKVIKRMIYGGSIREIGSVIENLTSEEEKRMLKRGLIEEYKEDEPKAADSSEDYTGDDSGNEDIEEQIIEPYTEAELKSFDRTKLLKIAKELELTVQSNIGVEKLITKILDEYKVIEKESQDENKDKNPEE